MTQNEKTPLSESLVGLPQLKKRLETILKYIETHLEFF